MTDILYLPRSVLAQASGMQEVAQAGAPCSIPLTPSHFNLNEDAPQDSLVFVSCVESLPEVETNVLKIRSSLQVAAADSEAPMPPPKAPRLRPSQRAPLDPRANFGVLDKNGLPLYTLPQSVFMKSESSVQLKNTCRIPVDANCNICKQPLRFLTSIA